MIPPRHNVIAWPGKKRRKKPKLAVLFGVGLAIGGLLGGVFLYAPLPAPFSGTRTVRDFHPVHFDLCYSGGGRNCVVDGDTIWIDGENVRLADIDAPETHPSRCAHEAELGERATRRLQELLNDGPVALQTVGSDRDVYGRALRIVTTDGVSVGQRLVGEGLARAWIGSRQPWCS